MKFKEFVQPLQYKTFAKALSACGNMRSIGSVGERKIHVITVNPAAKRTVLFVAGVHGDEVAGPLAVLQFLERTKVPKDLRVLALPLANPAGFDAGTRNATGDLNINRQFRKKQPPHESGLILDFLSGEQVDFFHSLHEDDEADGFYLYYQDKSLQSCCEDILKIGRRYMSLESREVIYGDPVEQKGLIFVEKKEASRHADSLEGWMFRRGVKYITTETPVKLALDKRVNCHMEVMKYIIGPHQRIF